MITGYKRNILLAFLLLGLLSMLLASIWQRMAHPSLVVHRMEERTRKDQPEELGGIGQLMQQVAKNPGDISMIVQLVESLMAIGQWKSAENFAHNALELDPGSALNQRAQYLLAVIHHNQGEHAQAAELLEKLLENEENPSARYSLGILYLHFLNKREAGLEQLRKGLEAPNLSPGLAQALTNELDKAELKAD